MSTYQIVGLLNNQILLEFDGKAVNFPLPIVDGLYPQGDELSILLDQYVAGARETANRTEPVAGNQSTLAAMVVPLSDLQLAKSLRAQRNILIISSDKTQLADAPYPQAQQRAWANYRAALRDLPTQSGFPREVVWPIPPSILYSRLGVPFTKTDGSPVVAARVN